MLALRHPSTGSRERFWRLSNKRPKKTW